MATDTPESRFRTWGRSRAVRCDAYDYRSAAVVHVVICAAPSASLTADRLPALIAEAIEFRCTKHNYRLFGYCIMPDHVHVLFSPADSSAGVETWLQRFKSYTAHEFVRRGGSPPLWQRSAYDHVCSDGETAETILAYIANNPVRKGLVDRWQVWPWTRTFIQIG